MKAWLDWRRNAERGPMDDVTFLPNRHKLDIDDYYRMGDVGILRPEDRVELIDGEIIDMMPTGEGHISVVNRLNRALVLACGDRAIVSVQNPVRLDRFNQPQPDFALLRPRDDFYAAHMPGAADVLLLVEVADSSVRYDQTVKLPLYARFGVPEYWLVNLKTRVLDAYRLADGSYGEPGRHGPGERLPLAAAPEIAVPLDRLFG